MKIIAMLLYPGLLLLFSSCAITLENENHTSRDQATTTIPLPGMNPGDCIPANENSFEIDVDRNNYTGLVRLPSLTMLINGESIHFDKPASGTFGRYKHVSCDIPADGKIRFRYMFTYHSGLDVTGPSSIKRRFYPSNGYMLDTLLLYDGNTFSSFSWESNDKQENPLSDTIFNGPFSTLRKEYVLSQAGLTTISSFSLTTNLEQSGTFIPEFDRPTIYDRETGLEISDFTVTPLSGTFPVRFPENVSSDNVINLKLNYDDRPESSARLYKLKIIFPRTIAYMQSEFTIWADVEINNPN